MDIVRHLDSSPIGCLVTAVTDYGRLNGVWPIRTAQALGLCHLCKESQALSYLPPLTLYQATAAAEACAALPKTSLPATSSVTVMISPGT